MKWRRHTISNHANVMGHIKRACVPVVHAPHPCIRWKRDRGVKFAQIVVLGTFGRYLAPEYQTCRSSCDHRSMLFDPRDVLRFITLQPQCLLICCHIARVRLVHHQLSWVYNSGDDDYRLAAVSGDGKVSPRETAKCSHRWSLRQLTTHARLLLLCI